MELKISKRNKDIIQKHTSALFKDMTLEIYGVKTAKIKELINVELPFVEVGERSMDIVFLLEDETYLHIEFQTTFNKTVLPRFLLYDARLYGKDERKIQTVIIYSSNVRSINKSLDIGSAVYTPINVMMCDYDGNAIYRELEAKLKSKQELTDKDILNLIFLPLMKSDISKVEIAKNSIKLAQTIEDKKKRDACIASSAAFMEKYFSDDEMDTMMGVLLMTDVFTRAMTKAIERDRTQIAKKTLAKNEPVEKISDFTELDIEMIKELQKQQEQEKETKK